MSKDFHDDGALPNSADIAGIFERMPEAEEYIFAFVEGDAGVEDLAELVLPEVGMDVSHWEAYEDTIRTAVWTYLYNRDLLELEEE